MSRFVPPHDLLDRRELPDGFFQLLAPLWYESDALTRAAGRPPDRPVIVRVAAGFVNDQESIRWYVPILYVWLAVKRKASRSGSVHDWLYQVHKAEDLEVPQWLADAVYWEAAELDGNDRVTRWVKWAGVRLGGASSYESGPRRFQVHGNDRRARQRPEPAEQGV